MTSNPDAVTESNDTASPMIHLLGAGAGLDAYDEKDTIPTMLLSQSADPPREFLDCRTPLENPDADLSACLWSREALLHTSLNSDSDELCFSDYSLSSTHTVRVREDARAQASRSFVYTSTKPAMRAPTSNERHWWLAKPVGRNSLCHLDPTGTRTPNSAESSSVALTTPVTSRTTWLSCPGLKSQPKFPSLSVMSLATRLSRPGMAISPRLVLEILLLALPTRLCFAPVTSQPWLPRPDVTSLLQATTTSCSRFWTTIIRHM